MPFAAGLALGFALGMLAYFLIQFVSLPFPPDDSE